MSADAGNAIDWDALRAFRAVARAGSLRAAAGDGPASAATLSRRIATLERALGCRLLIRDADGQRPTASGARVLAIADQMHDAALALGGIGAAGTERVRVAAGFWMARFLSTALRDLRDAAGARIAIDWLAGVDAVDVRRRAAHIGIRNARPTDPVLVARQLEPIGFAVFRRAGGTRDLQAPEWLASVPGTPSAAWVDAQPGTVVTRVSDPLLVLPLLHADVGIAVLPCFVGDPDPLLARVGAPIDALTHRQWLIAQPDDRERPSVRRTIEAIVSVTREAAPLLSGRSEGA